MSVFNTRVHVFAALMGLQLLLAGCRPPADLSNVVPAPRPPAVSNAVELPTVEFPPAPAVTEAPLGPATMAALDRLCDPSTHGDALTAALGELAATRDARIGWIVLDCLRSEVGWPTADKYVRAFVELTSTTPITGPNPWLTATNRMLVWDVPAPPDYVRWKRAVFEDIEPRWKPFFDDADAAIDWRLVTWGGVLMDQRNMNEMDLPCLRCIPALDDPHTTPAQDGNWYPDEKLVFGVEIGSASRAYPKNVMEIHELVNDQLGGRRFALPYCTLCGAAQLYFTDDIRAALAEPLPGDRLEMRTSGLLYRSNKIMFEFHTNSLFDTFTGRAVSGRLREADVRLESGTVTTATWGAWKAAHPATTIVSEFFPWGSGYPEDPLQGRDQRGPIFPIGRPDDRLPIHEQVLAVLLPDGTPLAFSVVAAQEKLTAGEEVACGSIIVKQHADGLRAESVDGTSIISHQAFWFAWSQFHPETKLWQPSSSD